MQSRRLVHGGRRTYNSICMTPYEPSPPPTPPPIPTPVQSLAYSVPWEEQRKPGLVTTIGVMCIVVACLSGFVSFIVAMYGTTIYAFSGMAPARSVTTTSVVATAGASQADEKLPVADVGVVDNTLGKMLALDPVRLHELDRLLRTHGKVVFPRDDDSDGTPLTAASVRGAVKEHSAAPDGSGAASFTTDAGSVDIFPDHAVFTGSDGTTIRTSAMRHTESVTSGTSGTAVATTGPAALTPAQVQQIIKNIKRRPAQVNAAQLATIQAQLSAPSQQLVINASGSPVTNVVPQGGNVMIQFDGGFLTVGPQGQVISMFSFNTSPFAGTGGPNMSGIRPPLLLLVLESFASMALAIYLLVVGIFVMRSSLRSPGLLRIYAWTKIPLALASGVALTWLAYAIASAIAKSMPAGSSTPPQIASIAVWGGVVALVGLAFPVGVLIALSSRTSRDFFNSVSPS